MKTKLLRKIRRRFNWCFREDGTPIIVDLKERRVKKITPSFIRDHYGPPEGSIEEFYKIDIPTIQKRIALTELGTPFGWFYDMRRKRYKYWSRKARRLRKEGKVIRKQKPKN